MKCFIRSFREKIDLKVDYPEIVDGIEPRHRFMSAYEQHIEPPDRKWQYLLFAAEPYETISFKLPSREIDKVTPRCTFPFFFNFCVESSAKKILIYFSRAKINSGHIGFRKLNSFSSNFTTKLRKERLNRR